VVCWLASSPPSLPPIITSVEVCMIYFSLWFLHNLTSVTTLFFFLHPIS
jgi:hypothetical protein